MADNSASSSTSNSNSSDNVTQPVKLPKGNRPEITAEIAPSDAYLLAMKQIDLKKDFSNLGKIPCSRQSLLVGIGGGAAVGVIRFMGSRRPLSSSNWAVAAFGLLSLTSWEVCRRSRASEHAKMKALMEDYRTKVKQKNSSSTSLTSEENDNNTNYDEKHVKGPHIGGVFIGEKGKEILRDNAVNTSSANTPNEKVERYV